MPTQFHLLSFEGPDPYARAGGLASRVDGLARTLVSLGFETHLWFVGDPDLPGHEEREGVRLHRWCQWLSRYHPHGVYDGEEGKHRDYSASLAPHLLERVLLPHLSAGGDAVVLAEEWQTVDAVLHLDHLLRAAGRRDRVALLWNANNVFGFDRIPWSELSRAAAISTVSRMMRLRMESNGVAVLVIPNGLPSEAFTPPDRHLVAQLRAQLRGRLVLAKVARWDPDKSWFAAVEGTRALKEAGRRPLLIARGGSESHGAEVRRAATAAGLSWVDRSGPASLPEALVNFGEADVVCLEFALDAATCRALYRAAGAVLANSRFEPFGLVGLEAMAAGGVACVGLTGEDYALPGRNALVLQTEDPFELVAVLDRLRAHPEEERSLRATARRTARTFAWSEVVSRILLPRVELLRSPRALRARSDADRRVPNRPHTRQRGAPLSGIRAGETSPEDTPDQGGVR
jgi:glycosyltransferase involved in cell wall biosynthesis